VVVVVVLLPSRPEDPAGVAAPSRPQAESARWVGRPWLAPLSLVVGRGDSTMPTRASRSSICADVPRFIEPSLRCYSAWEASLAGELLQRLAHRVCCLVTVGSGALADRAAFQGDDPAVEAGPVGVDADGVAAVAGRLEPVPAVVLCSRTAPWPWRDRIVRPSTVGFAEARSQGGSPLGRRGAATQRSRMVNHGVQGTTKTHQLVSCNRP
jgi:hypothetical protein